jgi:hypothetical protein
VYPEEEEEEWVLLKSSVSTTFDFQRKLNILSHCKSYPVVTVLIVSLY